MSDLCEIMASQLYYCQHENDTVIENNRLILKGGI